MTAKINENGVKAGKHILTDNKKTLVMWLRNPQKHGYETDKIENRPILCILKPIFSFFGLRNPYNYSFSYIG